MERERTMTVAEAARALEVSVEALTLEAKRQLGLVESRKARRGVECSKGGGLGGLPCFKAGNRIVFSRKAVESWIETGSFDGRALRQAQDGEMGEMRGMLERLCGHLGIDLSVYRGEVRVENRRVA